MIKATVRFGHNIRPNVSTDEQIKTCDFVCLPRIGETIITEDRVYKVQRIDHTYDPLRHVSNNGAAFIPIIYASELKGTMINKNPRG